MVTRHIDFERHNQSGFLVKHPHKYNMQQAGTNTGMLCLDRREVPIFTQVWLQPAHGSSLQNHHPRTECGKACIAQVRSEPSIITSTNPDQCKSHWTSVFSLAVLVDLAHTATDRCSSSQIKKACDDRRISVAEPYNILLLSNKKAVTTMHKPAYTSQAKLEQDMVITTIILTVRITIIGMSGVGQQASGSYKASQDTASYCLRPGSQPFCATRLGNKGPASSCCWSEHCFWWT